MLPKKLRIPRDLYPILSKEGTTASNSLFFLKAVPYTGHTRVSVSISKKIAKSAVVRNKLRRLAYKLLEKYAIQIKKGMLIRISWKKIPKHEEEVESDLESIINKINKK